MILELVRETYLVSHNVGIDEIKRIALFLFDIEVPMKSIAGCGHDRDRA